MRIKVSLYERFKNRLRNLLYKLFLKNYDIGSRVSKNTWEMQFNNGDWLYLKNEEELGHYECIIELYKEFARNASVLDIGCGEAVLYDYLVKANLEPDYLGIDISLNAINVAKSLYTKAKFKQIDLEQNILKEKYDVIIFNETLYYFNRPIKKMKETLSLNLKTNGFVIVSMCESVGHDLIWKRLEKNFKVLRTKQIENASKQKWRVSIFKPSSLPHQIF